MNGRSIGQPRLGSEAQPRMYPRDRGGRWGYRTRRRVGQVLIAAGVLVMLAALGTLIVSAFEEPRTPSTGPDDTTVAFDPPVKLAASASYIESKVVASGRVSVRHWIRSPTPLSGITLAVPAFGAGTGPKRATEVLVVADGVVMAEGERVGAADKRFRFARSAREVFVKYQIDDAFDRSGSAPGRALARVTAADVTFQPDNRRVTLSVVGAEVLALACTPRDSTAPPRPCGVMVDGRWQVTLTGETRDERVMAQLNLD